MRLIWKRSENDLTIGEIHFTVTNEIRNELNNRRPLHDKTQVVYSVVNGRSGPPYMPRQFPVGVWKVTAVEDTTVAEFAPIKIKTNAEQKVLVWALDDKGGYDHVTDKSVMDSAYHLHWSEGSRTTLGCGRVGTSSPDQVIKLASMIREAFKRGETVELDVIA